MAPIVITTITLTFVAWCAAVLVWAMRRDEGEIGIAAMLTGIVLAIATAFFWLGRASAGWGW